MWQLYSLGGVMAKWKDSEVKSLFLEVEKAKKEGRGIRDAFSVHASKFSRRPNSVRNYYYHEVDELGKDLQRKNRLGIDLNKHIKAEIKVFSREEESEILQKIDAKVKEGSSVRKACMELSGGDVDLMLRYQNKFRNKMKKEECPSNVLAFRREKKGLTDSDINGLFMGLVRLVKKSALEEAIQSVKQERDSVSFLLKRALNDLSLREKENAELKVQVERLKEENLKLTSAIVKSDALQNKLLLRKNKIKAEKQSAQ